MTTMMGVPPIYLFLAQHPGFADADLSSLERAVVGGAPMPEALLETWAARGIAIVQGYGLTEAAPNVLCLPPEDAVRKLGYAGKPYPFVDVRLSDDERAAGARPERLPRLLAQPGGDGGGVHRRRLAAHRRRRRARRRGLLPDQGPAEGHVHLRRRERLPGRGRGRAPRAPGVADAAVVGVADERWGEIGVAFVVADGAPTRSSSSGAARGWRASRCRSVRFVAELPRNSARKDPEAGARLPRCAHDRRRAPAPTAARSRRAASTRARGCSRPPSRSSASSATTTRRS